MSVATSGPRKKVEAPSSLFEGLPNTQPLNGEPNLPLSQHNDSESVAPVLLQAHQGAVPPGRRGQPASPAAATEVPILEATASPPKTLRKSLLTSFPVHVHEHAHMSPNRMLNPKGPGLCDTTESDQSGTAPSRLRTARRGSARPPPTPPFLALSSVGQTNNNE